ncbi:MAG: serine/threonine protein kinase, partial [Chloroflexi bacterium]|nr:serine/threonine protein kinase [Chloroflexota bacterium]
MITPLPAGSFFAGYQVDAVLARGGMGVVYLASEPRPRRRIALKLIAPALAADPAYRERFLSEVDALASLEHPHVVPIHAAGEWEGQLYLAMRYLDGPDLAEVVRSRGPLPPAEVLRLLDPIADALDVAHGRGIVHRDVTPANIRLDSRGTPYLTDFGLTKRAATSGVGTLTLGPMGTPAYMAPEQFATDGSAPAPDPALAPRADVYALGCVLVTLLTGSPPYPRDSYEAALWAHVHADPPAIAERRPGLPPSLDSVIARALAKAPAARFASAGELMAAA